jgi:tRNA(Ile)-lysidine synthase
MNSLQLINPQKSNLVAVSGGVDSIALMYVLHAIFKGNLRVLHINHGTRPENSAEQNLVIKHCQFLNIEVDVMAFTLNLEQKNFEAVARNLRAQVYKQYIQKNYLVYTAHHLDDSFEWSMIQSFKQSSLSSTLGIPVFNRGLVRPFMCVSKNQIRSYARALNLSWAEDSSNRDLRFERNFFRAELTQTIHDRYPQYLRHYVSRQNALALKLKKHRIFTINQGTPKKTARLFEIREASGASVLKSSDFSLHKEHIIEWIHFFSKNHRGEIDREVDKLILSHKKIAENPRELKMKGPQAFSGGVKIYLLKDYLLIINDLHLDYYQKIDEKLLQYLTRRTQITDNQTTDSKKSFFPYLCLLHEKDRSKSSKLIHPLLPKSTSWLRQNRIPYSYSPLIVKKGKQKLSHNAVILDSSLLGL